MSQVIEFAILGLGTGALYVLISLGLVIIHRVSGIVNYAQGAGGRGRRHRARERLTQVIGPMA